MLEVLAWMNTADARKKAPKNRPTPFVPEFMKAANQPGEIAKDSESHTVDEIRDILAKPRV